jgi:ribonucleoside-diphosphate reductase alpha chain/ribonucleoside-triphosphate reductase
MLNELEVLTRSGYRVTLNKLEIEHWDKTQKEDRLLGISPTSWMDFIEKTGFDDEEEANILSEMRNIVHESADNYADMLGLNHSVNYTAVKPSGTLGLLANGGSPGVHMSHSPYYWRTIRVSKNNPIYDVLLQTNWRIEDDVTKPDSTAVVYFPQISPVDRTKFDTTVEEQLERYKRFQRNYTDQNTSITVDVKNGEWDNVVEWLNDNWSEFTGLSFLSLTDHQYQQAPYITSTKKEIENAIKNMSSLDHDFVAKYMNLDNKYKEEIIEDPACSSGACGLDRI